MNFCQTRSRPWFRRAAAGVVAVLLVVWLGPAIAACLAATAEPAHCQRCPRAHEVVDGAHGHHAPLGADGASCEGCGTYLSVRHCGVKGQEPLPARGGGAAALPPPVVAWQVPVFGGACLPALATDVDDHPSVHPTLRFCVFLN